MLGRGQSGRVIGSPKTVIRAGLRRARAALWLGRDAWERRHEFGWRGLAIRAGRRLVYDIDDLVFDPAYADSIDALHRMRPYERRRNLQAMERRRELLRACDLVTVSTAPLARIAERLGRAVAVIPNSINAEQQ